MANQQTVQREPLHIAAVLALLAAVPASIKFTLHSARSGRSLLLNILLVSWVLVPLTLTACAQVLATWWTPRARAVLDGASLLLILASVAAYCWEATRPPAAHSATVFLITPPLYCILLMAALAFGRRKGRPASRSR